MSAFSEMRSSVELGAVDGLVSSGSWRHLLIDRTGPASPRLRPQCQ